MAALIVVFYHYLLSFYPGLFLNKLEFIHTNGNIEHFIRLSPFSIIYNSGFAVCLFFVISGYALSYKYFKTSSREYIRSSVVRRYFRLEVPILFSVLVSYILLKTGLYFNSIAANSFTKNIFWFSNLWSMQPDLWVALKEGLYSSLFNAGTLPYNPVLWTMFIEFIGSMVVFSILAIFGSFPKRFFVYAILIILLNTYYIPAFIIGLALCDYHHSPKKREISKIVLLLLFIIALYFCSYQRLEEKSIWSPLDFISLIDKSYLFIIGSSILFFVILNSTLLKRFFSLPVLQFLGKISFSLYLIHLLLIGSLACYLFDWLVTFHLGYHICFVATFILSLTATFTISYLVYKYVDRPGIQLSKWMYTRFFKGADKPAIAK